MADILFSGESHALYSGGAEYDIKEGKMMGRVLGILMTILTLVLAGGANQTWW